MVENADGCILTCSHHSSSHYDATLHTISRTVKSKLFEKLCSNMGAEHKTMLLRTEIIWLSLDRNFHHVLRLQAEIQFFRQRFLNSHKSSLTCGDQSQHT
jgi:hypothetical protein